MLRSLKYVFPPRGPFDVCLLQTLAGAGNLILNGNLSEPTHSKVSFLNHGYSRSISIFSGNDLSLRTFTVHGIQNGVVISEVMEGPDRGTVFSHQIYDSIIAISVDEAVDDVSVGTGYKGFFPLIDINLECPLISYSLSTNKITEDSISTGIFNTLDDIVFNGRTYLDNINNNSSIFEIKEDSVDDHYILPPQDIIPCKSILILINGDPDSANNSIQMNFIQI